MFYENVFRLAGFQDIENTAANKILNGTNSNDRIKNSGAIVKIYGNGGNDTVENSASLVTIQGGEGHDSIRNSGGDVNDVVIYGGAGRDDITNSDSNNVTLSGDDGNDRIGNDGNSVLVYGGEGDDYLENWLGDNVTIDGGDGNDYIESHYDTPDGYWSYDDDEGEDKYIRYTSNNSIFGGSGDDTIEVNADYYFSDYNDTLYNTINGGKGDDIVKLNCVEHYSNIIQYTQGDGNDTIFGLNSTDTLQITSRGYTTTKSGNDLYFVFNNGSITVKDFSSATIVTIQGGDDSGGNDDGGNNGGDEEEEKNSWKLNGTTATYGTSKKTLVTVKGVKSLDGLSLSGKVVTISEKSLNKSKVTISNGYTLKLASDVAKSTPKKAAFNLSGTTATYKSSYKTAGYVLTDNKKSISYTNGTSAKTLATVKGVKSKNGLSVSGSKIALKNSALSKKVTVSGNYEFDFAADYKNATITGSKGADKITARGQGVKVNSGAGNDTIKILGTNQILSSGAGSDVLIYAAKKGKEKITDFSTKDKLKIGVNGDGTYSTATSGDDVIVSTDDGGKIILVGAAGLSNLNIVGTKKISGKGVKVNGKKIKLTSNFEDSSFSLSGKYSSALNVDASAALVDLSIIGNKFSNRIIGSSQNDTIDGGAGADIIKGGDGNDSIFGGKGNDVLYGGTGKDTLWGGSDDDKLYGDEGKDVFYYKPGEGNDTIFGYEASVDKIILDGGKVSNVTTDRDNNVIFKIGDGQIVVHNAVDSVIQIVDPSGKQVNNGLYPSSN